MITPYKLRPITSSDNSWVCRLLTERWGTPEIITCGLIHQADQLPGFVAIVGEEKIGLVTYHVENKACEIVSLDSLVEKTGIGSGLIAAVQDEAHRAGCHRLWLITTNDNLPALGFYQKRGFYLVAVHVNALKLSWSLKPTIPLIGLEGIPVRDEIELEMTLD